MYVERVRVGLMIYLGSRPPILLFWLESIDFDRLLSIVRVNEPWGSVVGAVRIELILNENVVLVGEAVPSYTLIL